MAKPRWGVMKCGSAMPSGVIPLGHGCHGSSTPASHSMAGKARHPRQMIRMFVGDEDGRKGAAGQFQCAQTRLDLTQRQAAVEKQPGGAEFNDRGVAAACRYRAARSAWDPSGLLLMVCPARGIQGEGHDLGAFAARHGLDARGALLGHLDRPAAPHAAARRCAPHRRIPTSVSLPRGQRRSHSSRRRPVPRSPGTSSKPRRDWIPRA